MCIACWITKGTQEFTVYNSYSFTAATIVARARPDFHILVLPFAVYRKRKINEQYVVSEVHNSVYGWPLQLLALGTKKLFMPLDLHKSAKFTILGFSIHHIKFFCISCVHFLLRFFSSTNTHIFRRSNHYLNCSFLL